MSENGDCIYRDAAIKAFDDPRVEWNYGDVSPESVIRAIEAIPAADVLPRDEAIKVGTELAAMHGSDATSQQLEEAYLKGVEYGMTRRDVRPVVLSRDCVHYEMGVCLKIYDDGAANKDAWQERNPDDYCSYGEDRNVPTNRNTDMRPTSMSGANWEES